MSKHGQLGRRALATIAVVMSSGCANHAGPQPPGLSAPQGAMAAARACLGAGDAGRVDLIASQSRGSLLFVGAKVRQSEGEHTGLAALAQSSGGELECVDVASGPTTPLVRKGAGDAPLISMATQGWIVYGGPVDPELSRVMVLADGERLVDEDSADDGFVLVTAREGDQLRVMRDEEVVSAIPVLDSRSCRPAADGPGR